jgi:SAM-dependent methyltransferase
MPEFSERATMAEMMDDPLVDSKLLRKNLKELDLLNRYTGGHAVSLAGVKALIEKQKLYTIVDLGCGSGDTMIYLAKWARSEKIKARFIGVDSNEHAIDYLKEKSIGYPEITGVVKDFDSFLKTSPEADIYISSLFCHHLADHQLVNLFRTLKRARTGFVINDLRRSKLAYYCSWIFTRLLNGTVLSKNDGPISVLRAFKKNELEHFLWEAGCANVLIKKRWLFRFLVVVRS